MAAIARIPGASQEMKWAILTFFLEEQESRRDEKNVRPCKFNNPDSAEHLDKTFGWLSGRSDIHFDFLYTADCQLAEKETAVMVSDELDDVEHYEELPI